MSIDPNKAFGMKATNRLYTLEFRRDAVNGTTEVSAVDSESQTLSFAERFRLAWSILTGSKTLGELVFPIRLRNSDLYHLSYVYRPEKKDADKPKTETKTEAKPAKAPKAPKAPKAELSTPVEKPKTSKPRKPRAPKAPKIQD